MKLFLDDMRGAPPGWFIVKNEKEFKNFIQWANIKGKTIEAVSFDHDLDFEHYGIPAEQWRDSPEIDGLPPTGYDVAKWYAEWLGLHPEIKRPVLTVHSANTNGANNIINLFKSYGFEAKREIINNL